MIARRGLPGIALAAVLVAVFGVKIARAANQVPIRLVCATYVTEASAREALKALEELAAQGTVKVASHAIVSKGADGKVSVADQRQRGTRAGNVVAGVVGLLGGPISPAVGAAGPEAYLTGDVVGLPEASVADLRLALHPNESTLVVVVEETGADAARKALEASAERLESMPIKMPNKRLGPARQPGPQIPATPAYP
jgi:uncharacterized membrane protein